MALPEAPARVAAVIVTDNRLDVAGAALAVASVAWTFWTSRSDLGRAIPVAALQSGCAGVFVAARLATRWQRPIVPVAVAAVVASLLVLGSVIPDVAALGPPLGYANANAALYVQVAIAMLMTAAAFPVGPATAVAVPLAAAFVLAAVVSGSVTAVVVVGVVLGLSVAIAARRPVLVVGGGALAVLALVTGTAFVAVARVTGASPGIVSGAADVVDERRVALWADAAVIAHEHPLDGAGPGRFQDLSPTSRSDADARWAHSDFLQQAAEGGVVAMALLLAAFGWGFARLWAAGAEDPFTALGAVALASLGLHAGVDYVLHFPLLALVGVALVGAATTRRPAPQSGNPG